MKAKRFDKDERDGSVRSFVFQYKHASLNESAYLGCYKGRRKLIVIIIFEYEREVIADRDRGTDDLPVVLQGRVHRC